MSTVPSASQISGPRHLGTLPRALRLGTRRAPAAARTDGGGRGKGGPGKALGNEIFAEEVLVASIAVRVGADVGQRPSVSVLRISDAWDLKAYETVLEKLLRVGAGFIAIAADGLA